VAVIAPAGYGKTVLLSQWASEDGREVVWLTLDGSHDDPAVLLGRIVAGLGRSEPLPDEVLAPLSGPSPDYAAVVVPRLCEAIAARRERVVIVLSDMHRIGSPAALGCVAALAERMPDGSTLALSARFEPEIGIGRLRAHGRLEELRVDEMAMTRSEAAALFAATDVDLPQELTVRLLDHTEGWPAALYLAALGMRDAGPTDYVARFAGDERLVADYMRDEFLSSLDPADLGFLVRASLLHRLDGNICDAVLGTSGSAGTLRRLSRSNLLLAPVDSKDVEFRMHPLMREMLQAELGRLGHGEEAELSRRAAAWSSDHGESDRAVEYAIASGDAELAARSIWAVAPAYSTEGRIATLHAWLDHFDDETISSSPELALSAAVTALTDGDGARLIRWSTTATSLIAAAPDPDPMLVGIAEMLRLSGDAAEDLGVVADTAAAFRERMPERSIWRTYGSMLEGLAAYLIGDRERAKTVLDASVSGGGTPAPSPQSISRGALALIALDRDRDADAALAVTEALSRIELYGLHGYRGSAVPFAAAALVRGRQGATDAARWVDAAEALIDSEVQVNSWYEATIRITLARAKMVLGDPASARSLLQEANVLRESHPEAVVLGEWLDAAREELDAGGGPGERWPLTPAERRLLHLLPTHLSFPEIADQLIVSTNTVKTQARSIYRKLGVSSRSEAVECARVAGMLERGRDSP
jgi:LuxR family maltose regulon positive regulatory protein